MTLEPYYKNEMGKLYCCNCLDLMSDMDAESVDLTVTSPPYDNLRDYKGYDFDFESIAQGLFRVTKKGGVVVWVVGDATVNGSETGASFRQALGFMGSGFSLHDTMIYEKGGFAKPEGKVRYHQIFEYMFIFSKGKPQIVNLIRDRMNLQRNVISKSTTQRQKDGSVLRLKDILIKEMGYRFNIWKYGVGYMKSTTDRIAFRHPACFPESLAGDHILTWSNEGNLIFDPMVGSGTVPKMAEKLKRRWIACDIAEEYCEIAKKRIVNSRAQLTMF